MHKTKLFLFTTLWHLKFGFLPCQPHPLTTAQLKTLPTYIKIGRQTYEQRETQHHETKETKTDKRTNEKQRIYSYIGKSCAHNLIHCSTQQSIGTTAQPTQSTLLNASANEQQHLHPSNQSLGAFQR